MAQLHCIKRYL